MVRLSLSGARRDIVGARSVQRHAGAHTVRTPDANQRGKMVAAAILPVALRY